MNDLSQAGVIPLEQLYLAAIVGVVKSDRLDAVLQTLGDNKGRLWLVSSGTTVPIAQVSFSFGVDVVDLGIVTRDERELVRTVKYAEGIDGFLQELTRFLQANRLAAPTRRRA